MQDLIVDPGSLAPSMGQMPNCRLTKRLESHSSTPLRYFGSVFVSLSVAKCVTPLKTVPDFILFFSITPGTFVDYDISKMRSFCGTIEPMERDTESSVRFIQKMVPFDPHNPQQWSDTGRGPPYRSSAYIVRDNASTLHRDRKWRVIP